MLADRQAAVSRTAAELADHAAAAGIGWQAAAAEPDGFTERAGARVAARLEAVRAIRAALESHRRAEHARDLARLALDRALEAVTAAERAEQAAADAVAAARADAQATLARWAAAHAGVLDEAAMRELTENLSVAIEASGDPEAATLESVFTGATAAAEQTVRDQQARVRAERGAGQAERDRVAAERDRIAAERDDAPPAHPGRTAAGRDGTAHRCGGWSASPSDVGEARAAALEAALEATGMLDAWITPGDLAITAGDSDGYLVPGAPVRGGGASLADVLVPEDDIPVPAARVRAVLASIAAGR